MNCPLCQEQMYEVKWNYASVKNKFEFVCKKHGDYDLKMEAYYVRDCIDFKPLAIGPWHQIITPGFALNWFEYEKEISAYKIHENLFLQESNKSLQDFLNLYYRLNNLKVFL